MCPLTVRAEEPYQRFLQKLREERLFDLALVYLDDLQNKPTVSRDFKAEIQLERGLLLYQSAAILSATNTERPQKLDEAEAALRAFLENRRNHPRRGEARLKLGELLLTRAVEAKSRMGGDSKDDIPGAIKFYDDAYQLFEATIGELGAVLESMKGARVDPSDTAKVAYRQKVQQDLRQAQLLSAKSVEDRGRSRAEGNPQRKADLEAALTMFSDLYVKERQMIGIHNYALFYRSAIQSTLGKVDDAIDGFQRIADLEGVNVDILRPLQTNAVTELVKLLAQQGKFPPAIDRGDKWLVGLRPDERTSPETLALQLELARQKIRWATELRAKDNQDRVAPRLVRDARGELRSMLRVPGAHVDQTRALLGQLGVESSEKVEAELPKVKDFAEAFAAAQERIDRSETNSIGLETLRLELADPQTSPERKQELTEQLQTAEAAIDVDRQQAIELLQSALRLFRSTDDRSLLFDARFRLAFLLLKQQRPWDALALAEFLSRSSAGTPQGLRAAAIALASFSDLLRSAGPEAKRELTDHLQPFAEFLVKTWAKSPEASAAASALVQLALMNKDWEKAEEFLKLVPPGSETTSKLHRDAGISFYAKYLEEKDAAGDEAEPSKLQFLRDKAVQSLQQGVQGLTQDNIDASSVDAVNVLARLLLLDGQLDAAAQLIFDGASSPVELLEKKPGLIPAKVAMESYRMAIQLLGARLAEDKIAADAAVPQMRNYIKRLQEIADEDADGSRVLTSTFVALARDLKEQLVAAKDESKRRKMSEALLLVAIEAAKSESFNTRYWAADTIISIAQELESSPQDKLRAAAAYGEASKIMEDILSKEKDQSGWIDPPSFATQIRLKLAQTDRALGDYRGALDQLATILEKNNGLLDVQMEAARTYQALGKSANPGFHKLAIEGGRPDPKTRQKLIWGWGKIQQVTANQPNFAEQFFEARYQLAYSRWQYAKSLQDPQQKTDEIGRAENDIQSTAKLFPSLGGPAMKKKFDALLQAIQKSRP